jgi:hypothetical protein
MGGKGFRNGINNIKLDRRTWCAENGTNFDGKMADFSSQHVNPGKNKTTVTIDEKTAIQAAGRSNGCVANRSGTIVRGQYSTYRRNGTANLFAALGIKNGIAHTKFYERKRRVEFLDFFEFRVLLRPRRQSHTQTAEA